MVTAPVINYPEVGDVQCRMIALDEADTHMRGSSLKKKAPGEAEYSWFICIG